MNKPVAWMDEDENVIFEKNWAYPIPLYTHPSDRIAELEQQLKQEIQARADALDDLNNKMMKFMKSYNEMAWKLEEVGGAYTHPVKELTDEEIKQIFVEESGFDVDTCPIAIMDFAKAILRKAQEK